MDKPGAPEAPAWLCGPRARPIICDGAWASHLRAKFPGLVWAETCNLDAPAAVRALARHYVDAGAEVLWTNTFSLSNPDFPGRADRDALLRAGVDLARAAAGPQRKVIAALGPGPPECCALLARAAADAGADAVVFETQTSARACAETLRAARMHTPIPLLASFTLRPGGHALLCGTSLVNAARHAQAAGAIALGVNCCDGPETVLAGIQALAAGFDIPLFARPNAGLPTQGAGGLYWPLAPGDFGPWARALADAGAALVGGCCGVGPAHIRAACDSCIAR